MCAERKAAILLPMYGNPAEEWQQLNEHYHKMWDEELNQLAEDFGNLTETAQQVLRNEMRNRGLRDPVAPGGVSKGPFRPAASPSAPRFSSSVDPISAGSRLGDYDAQRENESRHEYTWKTPLCECDTTEQAWQLHAALKHAGIDSWVDNAGSRGGGFPRVVVAADQIEEAHDIAARPSRRRSLKNLASKYRSSKRPNVQPAVRKTRCLRVSIRPTRGFARLAESSGPNQPQTRMAHPKRPDDELP